MSTDPAGKNSFEELTEADCRAFLAEETVGRVGWTSPGGPVILPVTYLLRDDLIAFRTSPYGTLAQLITPTSVAFQVDELDRIRRVGRSVLVQGTSKGAQASGWEPGWQLSDVTPWATGTRNVFIEIQISAISGRAIRSRH